MISCFFSSNFLINSSNPSVILLSCYSSSLASSSFTYSTILALSSISLFVLSIIFLKSITFYFTEFAIIIIITVFLTHFFNLHKLMPVVVVIDTLNTDLDGAGFAKVLNHFMRMSWTRYALKITKEQRHSFFTIDKIEYFLIFPAFFRRPLNYRLIVIGTLSKALILKHIFDTCLAKCAPALMKNGRHAFLKVEWVAAVVTEE
jgi:hypothetical protein